MAKGGEVDTEFKAPEWTRDYYPQVTDAVMGMLSTPAPMYAGMRDAPLNAYQQGAGQLLTDKALYGDPQTNTARGSLTNISMGGAMNPYASNAYTNQMIEDNAGNMVDAYNNGAGLKNSLLMARKGAFGGSADMEQAARGQAGLAQNVGQMANQVRFNQNNLGAQLWNQDVGNMMQAAGMAPMFSQLDSQNFKDMGGWGNQLQGQLQQELGTSYNTYMDQYNHPFKMADWGMGALGSLSGRFGSNWQGNSPNVGAGLLGALFGGL
jgi:hypothetical protein